MWLIFAFGFALFIASTNCALDTPLCPKGGLPVCAKADYEFIYFENECKLNVYSYKQVFAGKPRPIRIALEDCFSNCAAIICPQLYQHVCAQQISTGHVRTLSNGCLVNQLICETREQWIIVGNGPCLSTAEASQGDNEGGTVSASIPHSAPAHTAEAPPAAPSSYEPASGHYSSLEQRLMSDLPLNKAPVPVDYSHKVPVEGHHSPLEHRLIFEPRDYATPTLSSYTVGAPWSGYHSPAQALYSNTVPGWRYHSPLVRKLMSAPASSYGPGSAQAHAINPATYTRTLTESASSSNKYLIETYAAGHPTHTISGSFSSAAVPISPSYNDNQSPQPTSDPNAFPDHSTVTQRNSYGTTANSTPASANSHAIFESTLTNYPQPASSPVSALSQNLILAPPSYTYTSNYGASSPAAPYEGESTQIVPQEPTAATYLPLERVKATHLPFTDYQVPDSAGVSHSEPEFVPHHQPSESSAHTDLTPVPSNIYAEPTPTVSLLNHEPMNYNEDNRTNNDGYGADSIDDLPIDHQKLASSDSYFDPAPVSSEPTHPVPASETVPEVVIFVNSRSAPETLSYLADTDVASRAPPTYATAVDPTSYTSTAVVPDYVSPSQASIHPVEDYSQTNHNTALDANLQSAIDDLSQAAEPAPTQEAYPVTSTPTANPTPYTQPDQYTPQVTESHSSQEQNSIAAPTQAPNSYRERPSSGLNIYFAPVHAPAPAVNVYPSPYRYPLLTIPNYNVPYAPAAVPQLYPGSSYDLDLWPSCRAQVELSHQEISPQEISQVYNSGLSAIVGNWIDRNLDAHPPPVRSSDGSGLGVPFYYQPTFTWIQYNDPKFLNSTY